MQIKFLTTHSGHKQQTFVGSSSIFGTGNDTDIMWLVEDTLDAVQFLSEHGYGVDFKSYGQANKFVSCRKENINVIVTHDRRYYEGSATANEVCKFLKLADKAQRIGVFEIIRDGRPAEGWPHDDFDELPY